jgi:hypothetical protein
LATGFELVVDKEYCEIGTRAEMLLRFRFHAGRLSSSPTPPWPLDQSRYSSAVSMALPLCGPSNTQSTDSIAKCYWENERGRANCLSFGRRPGQPLDRDQTGQCSKENSMKKIMLAVALIVASAAPVMAEGFPNLYQTQR